MVVAGLTGGLASGKSFIAAHMRELGCVVVEADELGHRVLQPDGEAYEATVRRFGPGIVGPEGIINRTALGRIVFADPAALADLNALVHPAVRRAAQAIIARQATGSVVVYVAAILIESGGYRDMRKIIVAECPRDVQIARALERPNATEADVLARLARQLPAEERCKFADYVIATGGTKNETLSQTKIVVEDLRKLAS